MALRTERLLLRSWRPSDRDPFVALNQDPRVMEFFPRIETPDWTDAAITRLTAHDQAHGFCFWAAELPGEASFIGFIGLMVTTFPAPFTPCVEVGWRLAHAHWGKGLATEGAKACLAHAFDSLGFREVVSFTSVLNVRSRRVMEKIGMTRSEADDFDHPKIDPGHPLRRHVLYRLRALTPTRA